MREPKKKDVQSKKAEKKVKLVSEQLRKLAKEDLKNVVGGQQCWQ